MLLSIGIFIYVKCKVVIFHSVVITITRPPRSGSNLFPCTTIKNLKLKISLLITYQLLSIVKLKSSSLLGFFTL